MKKESDSKSSPAALILIDHGSRLSEANQLLEQVAERIRKRGLYARVEASHMEIAEPTLEQAFSKCAAAGAEQIVIVPYFLASGRHATDDIPTIAAAAAAHHPGVKWSLASPLGLDDRMIELVLDRAREALESTAPDI